MFPSSPNTPLTLLKVYSSVDELGNRKLCLISKRDVIGINKSITSKEYYESKNQEFRIDFSVKIQSFIFDGSQYADINGIIYKVERTYLSGQFIELYYMETKLKASDISGYIK